MRFNATIEISVSFCLGVRLRLLRRSNDLPRQSLLKDHRDHLAS